MAQGINLPVRLVVIKNTVSYKGSEMGYVEYSRIEIDQMIGRAGRPQFDTEGVAVIMTEKDKVEQYNLQISDQVVIESNLLEHLEEKILQNIFTRLTKDKASIVNWLRGTFFYQRCVASPKVKL